MVLHLVQLIALALLNSLEGQVEHAFSLFQVLLMKLPARHLESGKSLEHCASFCGSCIVAQWRQLVWPLISWKWPTAQAMQDIWLWLGWYSWALQGVHEKGGVMLRRLVLCSPAGQAQTTVYLPGLSESVKVSVKVSESTVGVPRKVTLSKGQSRNAKKQTVVTLAGMVIIGPTLV